MTQPESTVAKDPDNAKRNRLLALLGILVLLYLVGKYFGLAERFDAQALRVMVANMGALGVLLYLLLFCAGLVLSVPGILFIVLSGLAWGKFYGALIALLGANLASIFSFTVVRRFHGKGFESEKVNNRFFKKMLRGLERHPVRTVALLRCMVSTAPGLNYGFAISSISSRQHLIGTLVGTVIPVVSVVYLSDWLAGLLF